MRGPAQKTEEVQPGRQEGSKEGDNKEENAHPHTVGAQEMSPLLLLFDHCQWAWQYAWGQDAEGKGKEKLEEGGFAARVNSTARWLPSFLATPVALLPPSHRRASLRTMSQRSAGWGFTSGHSRPGSRTGSTLSVVRPPSCQPGLAAGALAHPRGPQLLSGWSGSECGGEKGSPARDRGSCPCPKHLSHTQAREPWPGAFQALQGGHAEGWCV